jgi:hypothetical protein
MQAGTGGEQETSKVSDQLQSEERVKVQKPGTHVKIVTITMRAIPTLQATMSGTSNSSREPPPQPGGSVVGLAVGVDPGGTAAPVSLVAAF